MAHTDFLSPSDLEIIASKIGKILLSITEGNKIISKNIYLAESFSVWMLFLENIGVKNKNFSHLVKQVGEWHHQINYEDHAEAYARTILLNSDIRDWSIEELVESEIALKISKAINWIDDNINQIDKNGNENPIIRLLIAPTYYLNVFWIKYPNNDAILIIDRPNIYETLEYNKLYKTDDFLSILSKIELKSSLIEFR